MYSMHDHEAEIRAASAELAAVIERRDVAAAEKILGAEYALRAPNIGEMPRAQWLAALPEYVVHSYSFEDVRIDIYGEVGVMRSRYRQHATVFGKDRSGELLLTDRRAPLVDDLTSNVGAACCLAATRHV